MARNESARALPVSPISQTRVISDGTPKVPRALVGWPEGMIYIPRQPIDMQLLRKAAERADDVEEGYVKQHRGYGRYGRKDDV